MIESFEFQSPAAEEEFYIQLQPDVRNVVEALQGKLGFGFRITEVGRSDDDSERIYTKIAERLLASKGIGLHGPDLTQYLAIKDLSPIGVKTWCRLRSSWHKPFCAVDIGLSGWKPESVAVATEFLAGQCPKPMWEIISEPHGTGPHLHIARRDYGWLKDFPGSLRSAQGRKNPRV